MLKRSWIEVDLKKIEKNYCVYKSIIPDGQKIMAVVKADAYGHGAVAVAKAVQRQGCENFAVSNINEAIQLREAGIEGQILILGYTPVSEANLLLKYDVTQALISEDFAEKMGGRGIKAQFAIDTGMNRIGLNANYPNQCENIIRKYNKLFSLNGLFTHLCVADIKSEEEFTNMQISKFKTVVGSVSDLRLPYIHCMNTAGGLFHVPYGNLVRLGISLYGLKPDFSNSLPTNICPALEWKSVITMTKIVNKGETIGYGRSFTADKDMHIATVSTGYADGYNRRLSNCGYVWIKGQKAPVVGRICMDQFMVDITGMDVHFGDEVILIGDGYTADDMAKDIGTIGYEVVCNISKRVERRYI